MLRKLLFYFFLIACFVPLTEAAGTHVVGGDFTYRWISGNNFEVTLRIYRDCNPGNTGFDQNITIGIFDKATHVMFQSPAMALTESGTVSLSGPSACEIPDGICIEYANYIDTLTLVNNPNGYYLVWERCCRNATIVNIQNPLQTGMAFYFEMPDPALHNSSPQFLFDPLPFFCENQPVTYSFSVSDPDGDSVTYELAVPLAGNTGLPNQSPVQPVLPVPLPAPYPPVVWSSGYSLANICNSTPPLTINTVTGQISTTAQNIGMYAMAVIVREYRNGVLIGLIRREIEFSVIVCTGSYPQLLVSSAAFQPLPSYFEIFENDTLSIFIQGSDAEDSLWISVESETMQSGGLLPPLATAPSDSGFLAVSTLYHWTTACHHARTDPYPVIVTLHDNGCPLPFTETDTLFIKVKKAAAIKPEIKCIGLRESDITEVIWNALPVPEHSFEEIQIFRSVNGSPFMLIGSETDFHTRSFFDLQATNYLSNNYCYFIQMISACHDTSLNSDTVCTITQFNQSRVDMRNASVINNRSVAIEWENFQSSATSALILYRSDEYGIYQQYKEFNQPFITSWTDDAVSVHDRSYCYYIVNVDHCLNRSNPGKEACSILLEGTSHIFQHHLKWNAYRQWTAGINRYEVYRKPHGHALPFTLIASTGNSDTLCMDSDLEWNYGVYDYLVKAIEDSGMSGMQSSSNEVTLSQQAIGYVPSAFSPNQDGKNETWKMESAFVNEATVVVYNRWGQVVFQSDNKNFEWNGMFRNKPAPAGTYIYSLRFTSYFSTRQHHKTGTVNLIR